jgi:hypothetical protein
MVQLIFVEPAGAGWAVRSEGFANAMLFHSGAKAERSARKLAQDIAKGGEASEIQVRLRDGAVAGRFVCSPAQVWSTLDD